MPFPTTGLLDNFNRASIGADWSPKPANNAAVNLIITGSTQATRDAAQFSHAWWNIATYGPDSEAYFTIATLTTGGFFWIGARGQQPSAVANTFDTYEVDVEATVDAAIVTIYKVINALFTLKATDPTQAIFDGDKLGIEVTGVGATVTVNAYHNTTNNLTWADSEAYRIVDAGYLTVGMDRVDHRMDDFSGGTIFIQPSVNIDYKNFPRFLRSEMSTV